MNIETACQSHTQAERGRPACPRCGSRLLIAEQSAFSFQGRIRHSWCCDDCGNEFMTSVAVLPRQV